MSLSWRLSNRFAADPFWGAFFDLAGNQAFSLIEDETLGTLTLPVVTDAEAAGFVIKTSAVEPIDQTGGCY